MSNNSFDQSTPPEGTSSEQLVTRATSLIARASGLHSPYLFPGGVKDRKDELVAGPGYLNRLQKLGTGTVSVGITSRD